MPVSNINWNALEKFSAATAYAQNVKNDPNGGGAVVVHLQNGLQLTCNYSQTDAPKSLTHFSFTRTDEEKNLNNATRDVRSPPAASWPSTRRSAPRWRPWPRSSA